jgi:restriction system protein
MYGVVEAKRATAGVIATTSFFSEQAKVFQANVPCRLALRDYVDLRDMLNKASPHR